MTLEGSIAWDYETELTAEVVDRKPWLSRNQNLQKEYETETITTGREIMTLSNSVKIIEKVNC